MKNIGMVGVGLMGHGIATNIARHGYSLTVLEHAGNQPLDTLKMAGVRTQSSAAALAAASDDLVIVCVTGTPQVEAVLLGADGVLAGLKPGTIVIDCSTAVPTSTERIAAAVQRAGGRFIDAPMTRTPKEAAEGRLNLLVGGDKALFDECHPLLACFAENITHAGPVGAGHRMKLLHNYVSLGFVALLADGRGLRAARGHRPGGARRRAREGRRRRRRARAREAVPAGARHVVAEVRDVQRAEGSRLLHRDGRRRRRREPDRRRGAGHLRRRRARRRARGDGARARRPAGRTRRKVANDTIPINDEIPRMNTPHRIAVIPGDGIGKEVVPEGLRVLEAVASKFDIALKFDHFDGWCTEHWVKHGTMLPADWKEQIGGHEAIFFGAVGAPDIVPELRQRSGSRCITFRREFDQYVNLRPCKLMKGVPSPLANRAPGDIDFVVIRENTEGEYSSIGGRAFPGTDREFAIQESIFTRTGVDRVLKFAFELAQRRPRRNLTAATKSNGISITMPYWDERARRDGREALSRCRRREEFHIDILCAHFVQHPDWFDVVVASNLFGDILSDLGPA